MPPSHACIGGKISTLPSLNFVSIQRAIQTIKNNEQTLYKILHWNFNFLHRVHPRVLGPRSSCSHQSSVLSLWFFVPGPSSLWSLVRVLLQSSPQSWSLVLVLVLGPGPQSWTSVLVLGPWSSSSVPGPRPRSLVLVLGPWSSSSVPGPRPRSLVLVLGPWSSSSVPGPRPRSLVLVLGPWSSSSVPGPRPRSLVLDLVPCLDIPVFNHMWWLFPLTLVVTLTPWS